MSFISYLKDGISLGSIYAIIALGYTMVYGIAKMLNFAHGDVIMVGAFVILTAVTKASMSPILAIILSVVICTVAGVVIEAVAYRPLRKASSNLAVLTSSVTISKSNCISGNSCDKDRVHSWWVGIISYNVTGF